MSSVTHTPALSEVFPVSGADLSHGGPGLDLRSLVGHQYSVPASEPLENVIRLLASQALVAIPVIRNGKVLGLLERQTVSSIAGGSIYARRPVECQPISEALVVTTQEPMDSVFRRVFNREDKGFYADVVLVEPDGRYVGVVYVHTLVRLQNALLANHVNQIQQTEREIERKNAKMEEELKLAREMQAAFLPQQYPLFPPDADGFTSALKFRHHYRAAGGVSGDFLHVLPLSDTMAGVFLCDVMGHGVRAALVTAMIRALLQELCRKAEHPADLLRMVNNELIGILKHAELGMFATAMYMTVDVATGVMRYSIAGHAAPLHLQRAKGTAEAPGSAKGGMGPALGLFPFANYANRERTLEAGDAIVLFTDGLYEAEDTQGRQFGKHELMKVIAKNVWKSLDELLRAVLSEVERFAGGKFDDDFCLMGVEVRKILRPAQRPRQVVSVGP